MGIKESRRAEGIVNTLTDQDSCRCSDCGEEIDVSSAETSMEVVADLEAHRQECSEVWFPEDDGRKASSTGGEDE
jgi:hypothetical protein